MKRAITLMISGVLLASCVSQKKFTELEELQQNTKDLLDSTTVKLNATSEEKEAALAQLATLNEQNKFLKENNQDLIDNIGNLTTLSKRSRKPRNVTRKYERKRCSNPKNARCCHKKGFGYPSVSYKS